MKKEIITMKESIINKDLLLAELNQLSGILPDINEEIFYEIFEYIRNNNYQKLSHKLHIYKKFINKLKFKINTDIEKASYEIGYLAALSELSEKIASLNIIEDENKYQFINLLNVETPRNIIIYIYNNGVVQNKDLVNEFGPYCNQILNKFVKLNCLQKQKDSKSVYYILSEEAESIVEKKLFPIKKTEYFNTIIDYKCSMKKPITLKPKTISYAKYYNKGER